MMIVLGFWVAALGGPPAIEQIDADRARIQRHLAQVEAELRARPVDELSQDVRAERERNLDRLHAYWTAGEFPHNTDFVHRRVPYFIDTEGRACAVGHLVIESGAHALADRIRDEENNAKLLEMRTPGLAEWVASSGLTAQECARIQPTYCRCPQDEAPVCGTDGQTYLNECYATTCAGVEVAHTGACEGEPTGGWPEPGTSDGDQGSSGDASDDKGSGDDSADKGCRIAGRRDAVPWLSIVIVAALRKRRR